MTESLYGAVPEGKKALARKALAAGEGNSGKISISLRSCHGEFMKTSNNMAYAIMDVVCESGEIVCSYLIQYSKE
jgi:hypothetical protein